MSRALSALRPCLDTTDVENIIHIGLNPGHDTNLNTLKTLNRKKRYKFSKILKDITKNRNFGINVARNLFPSNKIKKKKTTSQQVNNNNVDESKEDKNSAQSMPHIAWLD